MGIGKFSDLFIRQFVSFEYLQLRVHGIIHYQYHQIKSIVNHLVNRNLLRVKMMKFKKRYVQGRSLGKRCLKFMVRYQQTKKQQK